MLLSLTGTVTSFAQSSATKDFVYYDNVDGTSTQVALFEVDKTQQIKFENGTPTKNNLDATIKGYDKNQSALSNTKSIDELERLYVTQTDPDTTLYMQVWANGSTTPIEEATEIFFPKQTQQLQLLQWEKDSAVFTTVGGNDITGTGNAYVYVNGTEVAQNTTTASTGIFKVPMTGIEDHVGGSLVVLWKNADPTIANHRICLYEGTIPYLSTSSKAMPTDKVDVVVPEGSTLTISSSTTKGIVTVNAGGKLELESNATLTVDSLVLCANAPANKYAQMSVADGATIKDKDGSDLSTVYYDYELDAESMYTFAAPGDVNVSDINIYNICERETGTAGTATLDTDFYIDEYNGTKRATSGSDDNGWEYFSGATLKAKTGYTIAAEKQLWGTAERATTILRIPVTYVAPTTAAISLEKYDSENAGKRGWNFIGNPYYTTIDGAGTTSTGTLRYYTVPSYKGEYEQVKADEFEIEPFHAFFVQTQEACTLTFESTQQILRAPARENSSTSKEYSVGISLSADDLYDKTEMLIGDAFDDTYEFNADLAKWNDSRALRVYTLLGSTKLAYNATSPALAQMPIPVGYKVSQLQPLTFSALDLEDNDNYIALYLYDNVEDVTTNLLEDDYTFTPTERENNSRFTLSCVAAPKTPTEIEQTAEGGALFIANQGGVSIYQLPANATVRVYDIMGRMVTTQQAQQNVMDITLPTGVYVIQISGTQTQVQPILIP